MSSVLPFKENQLCTNKKEFAELVEETIGRSGGGAFFKVFGKASGEAYYATMLIDDRKILAVEVQNVSSRDTLRGESALRVLKNMLESGPVIVDAFPLSDVDVKMWIVDNIDVYNSTPHLSLSEICPVPSGSGEKPAPIVETVSTKTSTPKPKPKKKVKFILNAPGNLEPYLRPFGNRVVKYAKSLEVDVSKLEINAKEIRYALGAGKGIHMTIEIEGKSNSLLNPRKLREIIEMFLYREARNLSEELGKKVVVSRVELKV